MCDFTPPRSGAWKHLATRQKSNLAQPLLNSRVRRVTTHICDLLSGGLKDSTRLGSYLQRHLRSPLANMNARGGFNVSDANQPSDMWRPWIRNDSTASLLVVNFDLTRVECILHGGKKSLTKDVETFQAPFDPAATQPKPALFVHPVK